MNSFVGGHFLGVSSWFGMGFPQRIPVLEMDLQAKKWARPHFLFA
jgi:hypothetical protein